MAFDGLVAKSVCNELKCLIGGKITKIFEPNKNEIVLGIYLNSLNYALNISIDSSLYRLNLTTHTKPNPQNVLGFCMVLRKHLTNGIIQNIYMNGFERVIFIDILVKNELNDLVKKTLVIELMGKHSNVILLNDLIVIDSLRHLNKFDNSTRDIFPGSKYQFITSNKYDFSKSFEDFYRNILDYSLSPFSLSTVISKIYNGFGKNNLLQLFDVLNIVDTDNSYNNLENAFKYLSNLVLNLSSENNNVILKQTEKDFFLEFSKESEPLFNNFFIDDFYYQKEENLKFEQTKSAIAKLVVSQNAKLKNKIENINKKLKDCESSEKYRLYGELITANLYKLNANASSFECENYYNNNKIVIPLDETISPSQNAKKYFKKYKKLQNTFSIVQSQKEEIENDLIYLDSIMFELDSATSLDELDSINTEICDNLIHSNSSNTVANSIYSNKQSKIKKSTSNLEPAKYIIDGYTVLVGKNNKQNDYLTCKLARNQDIWFHTKDIHGCHVILQNTSKEPTLDISKTLVPASTLYKCASLAAYFSKAKLSQNVPVDYTYVKYVKKPNNAKLGMVIYTNNKTIYANPDSNFRNLQ